MFKLKTKQSFKEDRSCCFVDDRCVYTITEDEKFFTLGVYVDDIVTISNTDYIIDRLIARVRLKIDFVPMTEICF